VDQAHHAQPLSAVVSSGDVSHSIPASFASVQNEQVVASRSDSIRLDGSKIIRNLVKMV
jgi:hypothetical protein